MCFMQCDRCGMLVNTDDFPNSFVEKGEPFVSPTVLCLCEHCQEEAEFSAEENWLDNRAEGW